MADTSDVANALVSAIDQIVYPSGDTAASATGYPARIYRGYPTSKQLDSDLASGVSHVTVNTAQGYSRIAQGRLDTTATFQATPTLTAAASGNVVTIGGTAGLGQAVGVMIGNAPYAYALTATDTPTTAAAALAARVSGGPITDASGNQISGLTTEGYATASGPTITVNTTSVIQARTACVGTVLRMTRQQIVGFYVELWCPNPTIRDAFGSYVEAYMSDMQFLTFADNTAGRIMWRNSLDDDVPQKEQLWKRRTLYTVEFAATITKSAMQVLWGIANVSYATQASISQPGTIFTQSYPIR
jgi:hypothetical protein